jgi:hypothetical protein
MRSSTFALFAGIAFLSAGLLGFMPVAVFPPPAGAPPVHVNVLHGYLLGLFPVNALHSAVHAAIGIWGIVAYHNVVSPRWYARSLAIIYAVLAVMGLIPAVNTVFGLMPIYGHDVWLHAAAAVIAAYFGWHAEPERRAGDRTDRRQQNVPVERDRRDGHDRRLPFNSEMD